MTRKIASAALLLAALPLAACAQQDRGLENGVDEDAPAVRVVGAPESCVSLASIRSSTVHSDYTIDFEAAGGKLYRNTLPNRCPGLGFEKAFSYSTSLTRLCSTDIIRVIDTGAGGGTRAACGLGEFVPVEEIEETPAT